MRSAIDLINFFASALLEGDVPSKVWTRKDVSYKHLRVFGYRVFVHILQDGRSKLDDRAKERIFFS